MIALTVEEYGHDPIGGFLGRLGSFDLRPLAEEVAEIVRADIREERLAGRDEMGGPLDPIMPATVRWRQRAGKGTGSPLAPDREGSTLANPTMTVELPSPLEALVRAAWPDAPWLIHHVTGTAKMVSRNPVYVSRDGWERIREAVRAFMIENLLRG